MRLEFLDSQEGFRGSGGAARVRTDTGLFWWTILITVLTGMASFCWFFSIYVFAHPEKPLNYQLLKKLGKLQEVKDFSPLDVPAGTIHTVKDLYARFYQLAPPHLEVKNAILKRNFISNYKNDVPQYLSGRFEVLTSRLLGDEDIITSGCVVRARSVDYPNVDVEYIVPTEAVEVIPYAEGDTFKISGSGHYASVIHVDRFDEEKLCFTAIPLIYPELAKAFQGEREPVKLVMAAPRWLNMEAEMPLTDLPKGVVREVARLSR